MVRDARADLLLFLPSVRGGGAERALVGVANALHDRGARVVLVLARAEGPYLSELRPGLTVVDLQQDRVSRCVGALTREIIRWRPRSVMSAMRHANAILVVAAFAARLRGVRARLVLSERGHMAAYLATGQSARVVWSSRIGGWLYRRADAIIAVSDDLAVSLREELGAAAPPIVAIPNPTITAELLAQTQEPAPHPWLLDTTTPVVIAAGRFTSEKGYDVLIEAFARVVADRPARLILLGAGPLLEQFQQQTRTLAIEPHVHFPGFAPNLGAWLARARLFVLSSRAEGLPNVLIQAMACGVPAVATDCPTGPAEILDHGRWGALVSVDDVAALADAMRATLAAPRTSLPDHALARFYPAPVAAQYASVLGIDLRADEIASPSAATSRRTHESLTPVAVH